MTNIKLNITQQKNLELVELYLEELSNQNKSLNTIKNYRIDLKAFVDFLDDVSIKEATPVKALEFRNFLRNEKQMKASSVNRKIASAKSMYKFLSSINEADGNIFDNVENVKAKDGEVKEKNILTKEEIQVLVSTIENSGVHNREHTEKFIIARDLLLVEFMARVGVRIDEALTLKKKQINFKEQSITLGTKSGSRSVPFPDRVKSLYFKYIKEREEKFGFTNDDDLIFVSVNGERLYNSNVLARLVKYCELGGLKHISAHCLRHTFATIAINNGVPLTTVSKILGHSSEKITYQVYVHSDNKANLKVCNDLF